MKKYLLRRAPSAFRVDYEKDLNPEQYAAVMHTDGPALVLAGAGTGKTRVVTYRVARLMESGIRPENILLLTFTNKAAREMMSRAAGLTGGNVMGLSGGTFHHIANQFLRKHYDLAGYRQGFSILDREDEKELLESCAVEVCGKETQLPKGSVFAEICGLAKNTCLDVEEVLVSRFPHFVSASEEIGRIIELYEKKKSILNLMDFDDLLLKWKKALEENDRIREYYCLKFKYILVDEYQDTNRLQSDIIDLSTGESGNLMVVGDDAQSIYSFRGADFENILQFPDRYPSTSIYRLTTNYRSTPEILDLANSVISRNSRQFEKQLHSVLPSGEKPNVVPLRNVFEQAEFTASVVTDLTSEGASLNDIAVLYRSHYQSMELQMELQRRGISFEVRSGLKFFEQAHIKDVLSYLRVVVNPRDEIAWKRILKLVRGIGNMTAAKLWDNINASDDPLSAVFEAGRIVPKKAITSFSPFLDLLSALKEGDFSSTPSKAVDLILESGYEEHLYNNYPNAEIRIEDVVQMSRFAAGYDSMEMFINELALQGVAETAAEEEEADRGRLVLSTVHQAKGLEWKAVFIIGMNDGRFPSLKSLKNDDEEEERRLFYVGVTRARESLYLCYPVTADDRYSGGIIRPSRFIRELPQDCFEEIAVEDV